MADPGWPYWPPIYCFWLADLGWPYWLLIHMLLADLLVLGSLLEKCTNNMTGWLLVSLQDQQILGSNSHLGRTCIHSYQVIIRIQIRHKLNIMAILFVNSHPP